MAPLLSAIGKLRCCGASSYMAAAPPVFFTFLPAIRFERDQTRHASILATLAHNKGGFKKRKRVGRGPSSGSGKTSGRGHKGTGQRGKVNPWFQGGQTPLIVSQGKKGEENLLALQMAEVNLDRIQQWIDLGRLDPDKQITPKELVETGLARVKDGVKLLGRNADQLRTPINIMVSRASASAIDAVERAGGRIVTRYYTRDGIRRLVAGESISSETPLPLGAEHVAEELLKTRGPGGRRLYRLPDPTDRWHMEYYRDPAHRGYLSDQLQAGESPSLFFKVPKPLDDKKLRELMNKKLAKLKEKRAQETFDQRIF